MALLLTQKQGEIKMSDTFKRGWRLSIEIDGKLKTYQELTNTNESLKVDFNITNCVYGVFAQGNITISNLSFDDMQATMIM